MCSVISIRGCERFVVAQETGLSVVPYAPGGTGKQRSARKERAAPRAAPRAVPRGIPLPAWRPLGGPRRLGLRVPFVSENFGAYRSLLRKARPDRRGHAPGPLLHSGDHTPYRLPDVHDARPLLHLPALRRPRLPGQPRLGSLRRGSSVLALFRRPAAEWTDLGSGYRLSGLC